MAFSVHRDRQGPIWPIGNIVVAAAGTPVNIMSLVDPTNANAPETIITSATASDEYPPRAQQIIFIGQKAGAAPPNLANNAGNVYIIKKPLASATNPNAKDLGSIIIVLIPGAIFFLGSAAMNRNVFNPYEYFIDADTNADAAQVTLVIQ